MCYFITIAIPESGIGYLKQEISSDMSISICENKHIMDRIESGYRAYTLTTAMCSCDLYSSPLDVETNDDVLVNLERKYKKKGWSDAKIERAIDGVMAHRRFRFKGLRADARELIARTADTLKQVYVFVHFYDGDQATEPLTVQVNKKIASGDFRSGSYILESDALVAVKGHK